MTPAGRPPTTEPAIVRVGTVPSTQAIAFDLAERGAPDRTVVLADHQTAGRGRLGRRWEDEPGASLLMSILLRPRLEPRRLPTLSYVAGIAVAEALAAVPPLAPRLKWPNDVMIDGLKIAGILLESRTGLAAPATIIGVGINLTQRRFEPALAARATSVALAAGRTVERESILAAILERLDVWQGRLEAEGFEPVRARWLALSDTIGRQISIDGQTGVARDLDEDGALVLETAEGRRRVVAGEPRDS